MPEPLAYLNGQFLPYREARLPLHDAGFIWGATVTDLCRTFRHKLFRLDDHLTRFRQSCQLARVPQPVPDEELRRVAEELTSRNAALIPEDHDLALVMFATPGPIGFYAGEAGGAGQGTPTLGMHTFPLPFGRYGKLCRAGARLRLLGRPVSTGVDPTIKMRSRLAWWQAEQEVHDIDPAASALFVDASGHVTETAVANFLLVKDGVVYSPPRETILGGISLLTVEELCGELGIPFRFQPLSLADCLLAQEAMLACTSYCLAGVSEITDHRLTWPGPTLEKLLTAWSQRVGLDIRGQILAHG